MVRAAMLVITMFVVYLGRRQRGSAGAPNTPIEEPNDNLNA